MLEIRRSWCAGRNSVCGIRLAPEFVAERFGQVGVTWDRTGSFDCALCASLRMTGLGFNSGGLGLLFADFEAVAAVVDGSAYEIYGKGSESDFESEEPG